jgi:hypothetical protein
MTATLLAISAAYVVLALLLLALGLTSRFAWWIKAAAIVVTSLFFVEAFFATSSLLGWPGGGRLPAKFELLWARVREPDAKSVDAGAVYLWVEEMDDNNVPVGVPRAYELPYSRALADRSLKARDEIMAGKPQAGSADAGEGAEPARAQEREHPPLEAQSRAERAAGIDSEQLQQAARIEFAPMPLPKLPAKVP